jgi:hypothetical protein
MFQKIGFRILEDFKIDEGLMIDEILIDER